MKMLLIDADKTGFPNLALMQLSTHLKNHGHEVSFGSMSGTPDIVFISCVFYENKHKALAVGGYYPGSIKVYGGTGMGKNNRVTYFSHEYPDYSLYPEWDSSLGFLTRGCFRICPWCVVPDKEGMIRKHSPLSEFDNPEFNKIMLLDNNLLSCPDHINLIKELADSGKKVCITQANDIRLITEENAATLLNVRSYDTRFKNKRYYFAWDDPKIEHQVIKGIETLLNAGFRAKDLQFYVLINFDTSYEEDIHRVQTLLDYGCKPYVMLYNKKKGTYHHHLKRWVERRYCEIMPWIEYDHGDSQKWIKQMEGIEPNNGFKLEDFTIDKQRKRMGEP